MASFFQQHGYNVGRGPFWQGADVLPNAAPDFYPFRYIAYYLPQFHRIVENDEWWGVGFTEWSNVTKAVPRYVGHLQPRLPADLGFYNLDDVRVLCQQADLANRSGIYGFCIHNYWFSGRRILERPLEALLNNPSINLRFCLNWANENWSRRWDGSENELLLKQDFSSGHVLGYVQSILPALRDPRYITIDGRPLVMIYRPQLIPNLVEMVARWREFLVGEGVGNPYLVMAQTFDDFDPRPYGLDAAAGFPPHNGGWSVGNARADLELLDLDFTGTSADYNALPARMLQNRSTEYRLFPGVSPGWDNEARRPGRGHSFFGSTPERYADWLRAASAPPMMAATPDEHIVFINAWNEWAEGAVLEPDRHFGHAYLAQTRRVLDTLAGHAPVTHGVLPTGEQRRLSLPVPSRLHRARNLTRRIGRKLGRIMLRS